MLLWIFSLFLKSEAPVSRYSSICLKLRLVVTTFYECKYSLRDLWDNIKLNNNIHILGVPEGEFREKGPEKIFEEIIAENVPNMGKESLTQIQEAQ